MKKKIITFVLVLALVLSFGLVACSGDDDDPLANYDGFEYVSVTSKSAFVATSMVNTAEYEIEVTVTFQVDGHKIIDITRNAASKLATAASFETKYTDVELLFLESLFGKTATEVSNIDPKPNKKGDWDVVATGATNTQANVLASIVLACKDYLAGKGEESTWTAPAAGAAISVGVTTGDKHTGEFTYNYYVDYGAKVDVYVAEGKIVGIKLYADSESTWKRTSSNNLTAGWTGFKSTEAAYEKYLEGFLNADVDAILDIDVTCDAITDGQGGAPNKIESDTHIITGATQSAGRVILAIQNALTPTAS